MYRQQWDLDRGAFLLLLDHMIPHLHQNSDKAEGPKSKLQRTTMLVLAVTLHNIPEGMAVGVVYAGYLTGHAQITIMGAMALSIGIAIQNFPEGAIISMPLRSEGMGKTKAFAGGVLSGIVEPIGAVLTILAAGLIVPALPYLLSFAAGAMLYVVVEELIPEMSAGEHSNIGTLFFAVGFSLMMILDVALGIKKSCPVYFTGQPVLALRDILETVVENCEVVESVKWRDSDLYRYKMPPKNPKISPVYPPLQRTTVTFVTKDIPPIMQIKNPARRPIVVQPISETARKAAEACESFTCLLIEFHNVLYIMIPLFYFYSLVLL